MTFSGLSKLGTSNSKQYLYHWKSSHCKTSLILFGCLVPHASSFLGENFPCSGYAMNFIELFKVCVTNGTWPTSTSHSQGNGSLASSTRQVHSLLPYVGSWEGLSDHGEMVYLAGH
jgi:hypothetical protein